MSLLGGAPGFNPKAKELYESVLQSSKLDLSDKQQRKIENLFDRVLQQGADPSQVAFEISTLQSQYPSATSLQPGGDLWQTWMQERLGPERRKDTIADANFMAKQIFGRDLSKEEKGWISETKPTDQQLAGYMYSSPESYLASFPTAEEQRMAAYYGRMVPTKTKNGGLQWTGYSSSIEPMF